MHLDVCVKVLVGYSMDAVIGTSNGDHKDVDVLVSGSM